MKKGAEALIFSTITILIAFLANPSTEGHGSWYLFAKLFVGSGCSLFLYSFYQSLLNSKFGNDSMKTIVLGVFLILLGGYDFTSINFLGMGVTKRIDRIENKITKGMIIQIPLQKSSKDFSFKELKTTFGEGDVQIDKDKFKQRKLYFLFKEKPLFVSVKSEIGIWYVEIDKTYTGDGIRYSADFGGILTREGILSEKILMEAIYKWEK